MQRAIEISMSKGVNSDMTCVNNTTAPTGADTTNTLNLQGDRATGQSLPINSSPGHTAANKNDVVNCSDHFWDNVEKALARLYEANGDNRLDGLMWKE